MYSHSSVMGAAEFQSHKIGFQTIIILFVISHLYSALAFAKSSHRLFILALSNTPVQVGICYPHFTDEEYETPDVK